MAKSLARKPLIHLVRQGTCALALLPAFAAIHYGTYWLRFEGNFAPADLHGLSTTLAWAVVIKLLVFGWFGLYQGWRNFVTFQDLVALTQAASVSSLVLALCDYLFLPAVAIPRSVFLMDWGATIVVVGGLRSLARLVVERHALTLLSQPRTPIFIVGANESGEALLWAIRRDPRLPYRVVGFLAEREADVNTRIAGIPVVGKMDDMGELAATFGVSEVFITAGELSGRNVRRLVEMGQRDTVSVRVLPSYEQLLHGHIALRPRQVSIEDLLGREPVELDMSQLHRWLNGQVLMITGSAGSIGSEICRQLVQFAPKKIVLVDRSETGQFYLEKELCNHKGDYPIEVCLADINDAQRMNQLFADHRPNIVFHAAAYKHVPLMELNPGEAVKNIALATRMLADLADHYNVQSFVMISTDKAVNPTSIMGACKRAAEIYVQAMASASSCRFVTVRFGNVLDSAGSVVPIFREQIAAGGPVTVTHPDMKRYFMTIPEASQLVIQAGAMGRGGEIFVLDMGEPVRIADLARDMIRLSGLTENEDVEIQYVGIRPGEKLYEELNVAGETHTNTSHPKIQIAVCKTPDLRASSKSLERLQRVAEGPKEAIAAELQRLVPQFQTGPVAPATGRRIAA